MHNAEHVRVCLPMNGAGSIDREGLGATPGAPTSGQENSNSSWYRRIRLADILVVALLAWWGTALTWGAGGLDPYLVSVACVLAIPALVLVRPWQRLPTLALVLAVAVSVAVWGVVLTAPTGFNGANTAATYALAATTLLTVAAWAHSEKRVWLVVGIVLVASFFEFAQAYWILLGSGDPSTQMAGTVPNIHAFAAFMIPGALLGMTVVVCDIGPLRLLGMVVAPLSIVAVIYSTSKGSGIILLLGGITVGLIGAAVYRWRGVFRGVVVWAIGGALYFLLSGPPFFNVSRAWLAEGGGAWASDAASGWFTRVEWWWSSLAVFKQWPLTGAGFHSVGAASVTVGDEIPSAFVHNGFLQVLAEGGLVLAVPFLAGCVIVGFLSLRQIWRTFKLRTHALEAGIAVVVLALMIRSGTEFDWAFPAVLMGFAIVAALLVPRRSEGSAPMSPYLGWGLTALAAASLVASAIAAWSGNWEWNFPV